MVKRGVFDYKGKPSKKGYPDKEPAQLDPNTGMHPEYGKKVKHDKLDPHSAEGMPMQGDPEIDANISKNVDLPEFVTPSIMRVLNFLSSGLKNW